jgi:predicted nucleotidyltransferase
MKFGLSLDTIDKINGVFCRYPEIEQVIIYGSRAKGNYREGSDIDITLKGENVNNNTLSKLKMEIDDLNTPYLFDISIFNTLVSNGLIQHIDRVGQILYTQK